MNRQIKFKGKVLKHNPMTNPDNGWVEGFYYQDLCGGEIKHMIKGGEMVWEVDSSTIGQFTGLYDAKRHPIYEGDIVKIKLRLTNEAQETNTRNADLMGFNMPAWISGGDIIARIAYFDGAFHYVTLKSYLPASENSQEPMLNYLFAERHPEYHTDYVHEIEVMGNIYDAEAAFI